VYNIIFIVNDKCFVVDKISLLFHHETFIEALESFPDLRKCFAGVRKCFYNVRNTASAA
jgi:hypothetical protein